MADLDSLSLDEKGFVLGAALSGGGTEGLAGQEAERCGEALAALRALPRDVRAARLARLAAEALAPVPVGIERVSPSRLIAVLSAFPPDVVAALVAGLPPPIVAAGEAAIAATGGAFGTGAEAGAMGKRRPADVAPLAMDAEALADLRRAAFGPLADP